MTRPELCDYCGHDEEDHRSDGQGGIVCDAWPDDGTENCACFVGDDNEPIGLGDEGDDEPAMCGHCNGSGMPSSGPPDRGSCSACGGSGVA